MMFPWGPWRPDVAGPNTGFALTADGVIKTAAGYRPFPALVEATGAEALGTDPRGSISLRKDDGTWQVFFGTATTIEQLSGSYQWTSIGTGYNLASDDDWSFAKFGDYLLNTNIVDGFRAYNVETPAGNNTVAGAPAARSLAIINNVVFAFDCNGNNRRMESSGIGDHTEWKKKGANGHTLEDGGGLVCGVDLKNGVGLVFQDDAQRLIQFGGGPALYSLSKVSDGRGSVGSRSVVGFDGMVFYLATDGFYKFEGGANVPIGAEKVDRWFFDRVATSDYINVQGSIDPFNKIVGWRINATTMLCYHWLLQEWFTATVSTLALTRLATAGMTLDDMNSMGPLDGITVPLDSRFFQGGQPVFAAISANGKFATFSGSNMAATLRTGARNNPVTGLVGWATPINDCATSTLKLLTTDTLYTPLSVASTGTKVAAHGGAVPLRGRGMSIAFEETFAAGDVWTYANGVDHVQASVGGPK